MNTNYKSAIVNQQEVNTLKNIIFSRVRERTDSLVNEEHGEVMDLARNSFVSENNPFSAIIKRTEESFRSAAENKTNTAGQDDTQTDEIGFSVKHVASQLSNQNRIISEQIAAATINNTMYEAREGLSSKKSFMGALNFLNSQAAVSLIKTRADRFEIVV